MAVKIRLQRGGATHAPHYRVVVADTRSPRDGRFIEKVGTYDPKNKNESKQLNLVLDRIDYWLSVGAQPSDTVRSLIKKARKTTPAEAAPVEAAPEKAAPVEAAPEKAAPVEAAPEKAAPVEAAPEKATPVEAAPAETAPAETTPAKEAATE